MPTGNKDDRSCIGSLMKAMPSSQNRKRCDQYITFGTCPRALGCQYQHEETVWKNEYFFAVVEKVSGKRMHVVKYSSDRKVSRKVYWIGGKWESCDAKAGDAVVFQASERENDAGNYGRVVLIAGSDLSNTVRIQNSAELSQEVEAFVLHPDDHETERYSALSITPCKTHKDGCKMIGIHVSCVAWDLDDRVAEIQPNVRYQQQAAVSKILGRVNQNLTKFGQFRVGRQYLAISVFLHSSDPKSILSKPTLTPVKISASFGFSVFSKDDLKLLWTAFQADATNKMLKSKNHWHFTNRTDTYKPRIITDEILFSLQYSVTDYFRTSGLDAVSSFRPTHPATQEICALASGKKTVEDKYLILGEHLARATIDADESKSKAVRGVLSSIRIMTFPATMEEITGLPTFATDVKCGTGIMKPRIVNIYPDSVGGFVNQQILLSAMLGSTGLYNENDLLGITVRRFHKPVLVRSLIRKFDDESAAMNYIDLSRCDHVLYKIPLGKGGFNGELQKVGEKSALTWSNFKCDEVEYDTVYSVACEDLQKCLLELQRKDSEEKSLSQIALHKQPSPYKHSENGLLTLDLIPREVIRLQICSVTASLPHEIGHRILRIGRNGHICLSHLNKPEVAFASDRHDLLVFFSQERIEGVRKVLATNKLHPTESEKVIFWSGRYNAGGRFNTKEEMKKGDLLCIRKDMYDEEKVTYVWNAHAVVTEGNNKDSEVVFATCTLMQPGEMEETRGFVIEYIKMPPLLIHFISLPHRN